MNEPPSPTPIPVPRCVSPVRSEGTRYFFLSRSPIRALGAFSTMTCPEEEREAEKRGRGRPVRESPDALEKRRLGGGGLRYSPGPCPGTSCGSSPPRSGASRRGVPPCRRTSWRRRRAEEATRRTKERGRCTQAARMRGNRRGAGIRGRGKESRQGAATPTECFSGLQRAPPPLFLRSGAAKGSERAVDVDAGRDSGEGKPLFSTLQRPRPLSGA